MDERGSGPTGPKTAVPWPLMAATAVSSLVLALSCLWPPGPLLVWNFSASSPTGLYLVGARHDLQVGDMAIAWPPRPVQALAAARRYLPLDVPLVKPVSAVAGDQVCASGPIVRVNRRVVATRRTTDTAGRTLPWWSGCEELRGGEIFLLSATSPNAFDGRYFGISGPQDVIGEGRLLWRR